MLAMLAMLAVLAGFALLVLLMGFALFVRGWRGRVIDEHPLCNGCGYDLVGSDEQTSSCPECGSNLLRSGAIRFGHRRKRPWSIAIGVLLLATALSGSSALLVPQVQQFDWNPYKPLWLLRSEADRSVSPTTASAAQREILARLGDGRLAQSQIDAIVSESLSLQADPNSPWQLWRGDFIEQAWLSGRAGDDVIVQYGRTAVESGFSMVLPQRIRQGTMLMVRIVHRPMRAGTRAALFADLTFGPTMLTGETMLAGGAGRMRTTVSAGSSGVTASGSRVNLPIGTYDAKTTCTIRLLRSDRSSMLFGFESDDDPAARDTAVHEFTVDLHGRFEVIDRDANAVELVRDAAMADVMRSAINAQARALPLGNDQLLLTLTVDESAIPVDAAFDVFVRAEGRETRAAESMVVQRAEYAAGGITLQWIIEQIPRGVQSVDVVLKPSVAAAEDEGLSRIWGEELVLHDVPVTRRE